MWMDVRIFSIKANSQADNMSLYIGNKKRPNPQHTQLGILKFAHFARKFS